MGRYTIQESAVKLKPTRKLMGFPTRFMVKAKTSLQNFCTAGSVVCPGSLRAVKGPAASSVGKWVSATWRLILSCV